MKQLLTLIIALTIAFGLQAQDTSRAKKNLKIGADWSYIYTQFEQFHYRFGLSFTFNDRHTFIIGPDFDIDFDLQFEYMDDPYLRIGYQFHPLEAHKKLKYCIIYDSRYNYLKQRSQWYVYFDNQWQDIPTIFTGASIHQYGGLGLKWHFWKGAYLQYGSGIGVTIEMDKTEYEHPSFATNKSTYARFDLFAAGGLGYDFKMKKKK